MIVVCNENYRRDYLSGKTGFNLEPGRRYSCIAHIVVNDLALFLVVDDSGVPGWIDARYFDSSDPLRPWLFSPRWGMVAEHSGTDWWRLCVAHRQLIPLMDRLYDGYQVGDADLVDEVRSALRSESARDAIIFRVYQWLDGSLNWTSLSSWAQDQLEEPSPKSFYVFSDSQISTLAELSAADTEPSDPERFAEDLLQRV